MTKEEFNAKVYSSFLEFKMSETVKNPSEIFNDCFIISKIISIKNFLIECDILEIESLYPYADSILFELYDFELSYDKPMWKKEEDMYTLIFDFIAYRVENK